MRALVVQLSQDGHTVLLSSHQLAEVQETCDRVGVIVAGRLLRESTVAELRGGASLRVRALPLDRTVALVTRFADGRGVQVDEAAGALHLDLPASDAPALTRALVTAGIDVLEVAPVERSLEEAFFEMTAPTRTTLEKEPAR
jgi:ABC-type multidrug transport system ATPase subunit